MEYFTSVDFSSWPAVQTEQRQRYSNLKNRYIDEPARRMTEKADDVTDNNPLALSENVSPIKNLRCVIETDTHDEESMATILC